LFDPANGNGGSGDTVWFDRPEDGEVRFAWDGSFSALAPFAATPGGAGAAYATVDQVADRLGAVGIPGAPASGHPVQARGLRDRLSAWPVLAGVILLVTIVLVLALVLVVRLRRHHRTRGLPGAEPAPHAPSSRETR
jgi:hypothetical protein